MEAGTVLRVRRAPTLLLAAALLAGCGGGGSKDQGLTREQYAAKADAICTKYKAKTNSLSRPSTLSDLAKLADQVLPLLDNARGELRALRPPQDEASAVQSWLDQFDLSIDDVRKIRDKAKAGDSAGVQAAATPALRHNQRANELAAQLGMTVCSKD
jgi:hypothetical protein